MTPQLRWTVVIAASMLAMSSTAVAKNSTLWPSLDFRFKIKRPSMNIHGQSDFSMIATPVGSFDNGHVLYDILSTLIDSGVEYNYSLIEGAGSLSTRSQNDLTMKCLESELGGLPPINAIVRALNDATTISSSPNSATAISCPSGKLFKVTVNHFDFALCASGALGFTMQSGDMEIQVTYLDSRAVIHKQNLTNHSKQDCTTIVSSSVFTPIAKALLTGEPLLSPVRLLAAAHKSEPVNPSSCSCKSARRPCIFIHGLGQPNEAPGNLDNFTSYWGNQLVRHAPCCSSFKFTQLDTVNYTWTNAALQQKVCDRVLSVSNTSVDTTIADTIVVTHSMGNLMFAAAIANKRCTLASSSTWVGTAGPMKGSMCSDFVQESCIGKTGPILERIGNITGRCPVSPALKGLAYQSGNHSTVGLAAAYTAAQEAYQDSVYAVMCSSKYSGIVSIHQAHFWVLGKMVPHKSPKNDGMVEFESCASGIPESKFSDSWESRFYRTRLNHYDMAFLNGDSLLNGKKMPLKWFECLL